MFINSLETGSNFLYRRSWKHAEYSVKSKNIQENLEPLKKFKKFMEGMKCSFWKIISTITSCFYSP